MKRLDHPPTILFGGDSPIGLTIVRELGEQGVLVHVVASSNRGLALYSKWAKTRHIRPGDASQTIGLLNRIAEIHGARYVMAVSETDLLTLRKAADENRLPRLRALVPPLELLRLVNDKLATYNIAHDIGIPVPRGWQPRSRREAEDVPADFPYPCILKWSDPASIAGELREAALPLLKAEYCYTHDELVAALTRYHAIGTYPIAQAYASGIGLGHMIFMHKGEALLSFQHIRKAEWPPEGGVSTVCSSLPLSFHPEWIAQSAALLRHIGWEGAAMVEYRFDPRTDTRALMEINGRFWGSLPLAYHAGARFAWLTYSVLGLDHITALREYRAGMTCRYMTPETRRVLTILFNQRFIKDRALKISKSQTIVNYLSGFFRPSVRYYVFSLKDPMPFVMDMKASIRKGLGMILESIRRVAHGGLLYHLRRAWARPGKSAGA